MRKILGETLAQIKSAGGAFAQIGWESEFIVCDNNSNDRTAEIARAVDGGSAFTVEEATARLDELDAADAIIFGCPTYMGNLSVGMKAFIEAAAKKWFTLAWKNKIAGAFTNSSSFSGDKLNCVIPLTVG